MKPAPYIIELRMGKSVELTCLNQYLTYEGLMAGFPNRKMNESIIERCRTAVHWEWGIPVQIIPPVQTPVPPTAGTHRDDHAWLPGVVCKAVLEARFPISKDADASNLAVVWFQNRFAMPIEESILEHLRNIDWNAHARDYHY